LLLQDRRFYHTWPLQESAEKIPFKEKKAGILQAFRESAFRVQEFNPLHAFCPLVSL
jgi:hypothetical protein